MLRIITIFTHLGATMDLGFLRKWLRSDGLTYLLHNSCRIFASEQKNAL